MPSLDSGPIVASDLATDTRFLPTERRRTHTSVIVGGVIWRLGLDYDAPPGSGEDLEQPALATIVFGLAVT